jgi:hypothetical protein
MEPNPFPAPGFPVRPDEPHVVTEQDRKRYPDRLKNTLVIRELDATYGEGLGGEPYGWLTTKRVEVRTSDELCPSCGCDLRLHTMSQDRAGMVGGGAERCLACHELLDEEWWD